MTLSVVNTRDYITNIEDIKLINKSTQKISSGIVETSTQPKNLLKLIDAHRDKTNVSEHDNNWSDIGFQIV